jgi:hypothetical protein
VEEGGAVLTHWCSSRLPFEFFDPSLYIVAVSTVDEKKRCCPRVGTIPTHWCSSRLLSDFLTLHCILESLRKATLSEGGLESGDSQKASTCFPRFECMKWALV